MASQKVSVTLEHVAIDQARRRAGPRGLSSYLDAALHEKLARDERREALLSHLTELDEADPPTEDEVRRAARRVRDIRRRVNG